MKSKLIHRWVVGWDEIEPVLFANIAQRFPIVLLGKHGLAKTKFAKYIAKIYGENGFRFYDATKDDLISIAGIPKPDSLTQDGKTLEFAKHSRTIWDAKVIVIDELTRANRENQNLWLEILEEKRCFGIPLQYESIIATMNPESYAATFKLDEALLDRFYSVVPVPDLQEDTSSGTYKRLIELQFDSNRDADPAEMRSAVDTMRKSYTVLRANDAFMDGLTDYVGQLFEILHNQTATKSVYISPRKAVQLTEEVIALTAYFQWAGHRDPINRAAQMALMYTLAIPLRSQIKPEVLFSLHEKLLPVLKQHSMDEGDKLRLEMSRVSGMKRSELVASRLHDFVKHWPYDEVDKLLLEMVSFVTKESKDPLSVKWYRLLQAVTGHDEVKRKIENFILQRVNDRIVSEVENFEKKKILSDVDLRKEQAAQQQLDKLHQCSSDDLVALLEQDGALLNA